MKQHTFSVITPIHAQNELRAKELQRCIASIKNQTYSKTLIEHIIVNDGSTVPLNIPTKPWIRVINQPNMQRITAYNTGLEFARNEIIVFLDSDDTFVNVAFEEINKAFNDNPDYKMINYGSIHSWPDGKKTERDAFEPKKEEIGHIVFGGGNIVNGTFAFKKEVYDDLGAYPPPVINNIDCTEINYPHHGEMIRDLYMTSPYDLSAWFQIEFPEIRQFLMVDNEAEGGKIIKEAGNPFGQDYILFYKFTRKYHSKPILGTYLYHVYHHEGVH